MVVITLPDRAVELINLYEKSNMQVRTMIAYDVMNMLTQAWAHNHPPSPEQPTEQPRIWNKNRSRWGGTCGECFGPIAVGEIVYLTEGTRARHLTCAPQPPDIIR